MPSPPEEMLNKHLTQFKTSLDSEIISAAYEPRFEMSALGSSDGHLYIINKDHQTMQSPKSVGYPLLKLFSLANSSSFFSICSKSIFKRHSLQCEKPNPHNLSLLNNIKSSKIENVCTHWIIHPDKILSRTVELDYDIVDVAISPLHPEFALFLTPNGSLFGFSVESLNFTNLYVNVFENKPVKSLCWSSGYRFLVAHDVIEGLDVQKLEIGSQYNVRAEMVDSLDQWTTAIDDKGVPHLLMFMNVVSTLELPSPASRAVFVSMINGSNWMSIVRREKIDGNDGGDAIFENRNLKVDLNGEFAVPQLLVKYQKPFERAKPLQIAVVNNYGRFIYFDGKVVDHFLFEVPDVRFALADEDEVYVFAVDSKFENEEEGKKDKKHKKDKSDEEDGKKDKDDEKGKKKEKSDEDDEKVKNKKDEKGKEDKKEKSDEDEKEKSKKDEKEKEDKKGKNDEDDEKVKSKEDKSKSGDDKDDKDAKKSKGENDKSENEGDEDDKKSDNETPKCQEEVKNDDESKSGSAGKETQAGSAQIDETSKSTNGANPSESSEPEVHFILYLFKRGCLSRKFCLSSSDVSATPYGVSHGKILFVRSGKDVCVFDLVTNTTSILQTLDDLRCVRHTKRRFPDFILESGVVLKCRATDNGFELNPSDDICPSEKIVDWRNFRDSIVYITENLRLVFKESSKKIIKEDNERILGLEVVNYVGKAAKEGEEEYVIVVMSSRIIVLDFDEKENKLRKIRKLKSKDNIINATFTKFGTLVIQTESAVEMLPLPDVSDTVIDKVPIEKDGRAVIVPKFGAIIFEHNSINVMLDEMNQPKLFDINAPVIETPKVDKFLKLFGKKDDTIRDADNAFQYRRSANAAARINETQEVMQQLLVKANERGELLNEMEIKSNRLLNSAQTFHQLAKKLSKKSWF